MVNCRMVASSLVVWMLFSTALGIFRYFKSNKDLFSYSKHSLILQAKKYIFKPDKMNSFEIQSEIDALAERQSEALTSNKFK